MWGLDGQDEGWGGKPQTSTFSQLEEDSNAW